MHEPSEPQLRAAILRDIRDAAVEHAGFAARVRPALTQALSEASPGDWLPAQLMLDLEDDLIAAAGPDLLIEVCRRATWRMNTGAFLRVLREQALKLVGDRPSLLFRWLPGGRTMATRGLGTCVYKEADGGCRIVVADLPPALAAHRGLQLGTKGSMLGLLDFMRWEGSCDIEESGTHVAFHVQWWARKRDPAHPDAGAASLR